MRPVEVIYLRRRDTMDTVRGLLATVTPGAQVWLVAPWRLRLTDNLVNLKLLKRLAESEGVDLRLVSAHFQTRTLAHEAGVPVYFSVPFRLLPYRRARQEQAQGLASRVVPVEAGMGRWERRPRRLGLDVALLALVVIVVLAGVLAGVAVAFIPSATVSLEPVSQPVSGTFEVVADPDQGELDAGRAVIPARMVLVELEGRGEVPSSGSMDVPDAHASGEVVFVNRTEGAIKIPKGTTVRAGSGVNARFRTVTDVELPAGQFAQKRVGIIAVDPGPIGNVKALTINVVEGEFAHQVEVLNDAPTQGGTVRRAAVVTAQDFDRLRTEVIKSLQQKAYEQFVSQLQQGEFVPPNALEVQIVSQRVDQALDQQSDIVSMQMKLYVRGMAISHPAIEALAGRILENRAGQGMTLVQGSLVVKTSDEIRMDGKKAHLSVTAQGLVAPTLDAKSVKAGIRGKKVPEARQWLRQHLTLKAEPRITIQPSWWEYLPWLSERLNVLVAVEQK